MTEIEAQKLLECYTYRRSVMQAREAIRLAIRQAPNIQIPIKFIINSCVCEIGASPQLLLKIYDDKMTSLDDEIVKRGGVA